MLQRSGKTLLYGCDGAWFGCRTWSGFGKYRYDCIILDATFGDDTSKYRIPDRWILFAHNGLSMVRHICESFRDKRKCVHEGTVFVADHHKMPTVEVTVTNQQGQTICHVTGMGYRKRATLPAAE